MNTLKHFRPVASSISLLIVAAAAASMTSLTTHASDPGTTRLAVTVSFGDLNLSTPDGVAALRRRIGNAARQVCPVGDPRDLRRATVEKRCVDDAISRALAYVGVPRK